MQFCVLLHVSMSTSSMGTLLHSTKISLLQWVASVLVMALAAAFAGGKADAITHAGQAEGELACSYSMANGGSPSSTYGPSANGHLPDLDQGQPVDSLHTLPNGVMDNGSPNDQEPSPHRVSLSATWACCMAGGCRIIEKRIASCFLGPRSESAPSESHLLPVVSAMTQGAGSHVASHKDLLLMQPFCVLSAIFICLLHIVSHKSLQVPLAQPNISTSALRKRVKWGNKFD